MECPGSPHPARGSYLYYKSPKCQKYIFLFCEKNTETIGNGRVSTVNLSLQVVGVIKEPQTSRGTILNSVELDFSDFGTPLPGSFLRGPPKMVVFSFGTKQLHFFSLKTIFKTTVFYYKTTVFWTFLKNTLQFSHFWPTMPITLLVESAFQTIPVDLKALTRKSPYAQTAHLHFLLFSLLPHTFSAFHSFLFLP